MRSGMIFHRAQLGIGVILLAAGSQAFGQKMSLEELLGKHLSAIGAGAVARKTSNVQGKGRLQILVGGRAALTGPFYLQSRDKEISYLLHFNISNYEHERFVANPQGAEIGYMTPGSRSPLSDFLYVHKIILREGLFGGVLTTAYPFFDIGFRQPRLKYAGLKKEDGRRLHRIDYMFKSPQGELKVRLFFDSETFYHVRTTYVLTIPAPLGSNPIDSARQKATIHELSEDFADFRKESALVMPHEWTVRYTFNSTDQTLSWEWKHELQVFQFDAQLDDAVFRGVTARGN